MRLSRALIVLRNSGSFAEELDFAAATADYSFDMATSDDLMATIDAKLSALLKLAVEGQSRPAASGATVPTELRAQASPLEANGAQTPTPPAAPAWPVSEHVAPPSHPAPAPDLSGALDEIARLLALSLARKQELADVVADLDSVGFDRARVGELLGISPSRVDAALVAYDRRDRKKRRR
jgi:hypothetical protein